VEIISGEQEAAWAFQGVTANSDLAQVPLLLLDVGGGSTEFILGYKAEKHFAESFPLGTVRLLEKFPLSDPPTRGEFEKCRNWIRNFLETEVCPELEPLLRGKKYRGTLLAGTGGTVSILARIEKEMDRFDREKIEQTVLSLERIVAHRKKLWRLPLAERREIVGLPRMRADVILTGVLIYEIVMQQFGFTHLQISTRGLRFAALMD
jgi:exopolyphosphatase/guanosine-5'-triphosphate,3'-diphosphate pyrophosphatase